jgi:hypothetical protein
MAAARNADTSRRSLITRPLKLLGAKGKFRFFKGGIFSWTRMFQEAADSTSQLPKNQFINISRSAESNMASSTSGTGPTMNQRRIAEWRHKTPTGPGASFRLTRTRELKIRRTAVGRDTTGIGEPALASANGPTKIIPDAFIASAGLWMRHLADRRASVSAPLPPS